MSHNLKRETMDTDQPGTTKDVVVERFPSTSGRITGVLGLVAAAIVLVLAILPLDAGTPLGVAIVGFLRGGCSRGSWRCAPRCG